ncbi:hypothetical protein D5086_019137 [Populus alba]|uniref:Uncharacterized protein n=1 Tax=Populus alba TaxID=43335 RepID=A0ACC4BGC8_POPAL
MGGCFPCFGSSNKEGSSGFGLVKELNKKDSLKEGSAGQSHHVGRVSSDKSKSRSGSDPKKEQSIPKDGPTANIAAQIFTFRELAAATTNFRPECLLGEGGFGRVYKGRIESTGQVVAVKQLDRNGLQGNREFLVETALSPIHEIRDESLVHALHTVKNMYFRTYVDIIPLYVFGDLHEFFFLGE